MRQIDHHIVGGSAGSARFGDVLDFVELRQDTRDPAQVIAFGDVPHGARVVRDARWEMLLGELVAMDRQDNLSDVVHAACAASRLAAGLHRREQQRHEHADDGHYDGLPAHHQPRRYRSA